MRLSIASMMSRKVSSGLAMLVRCPLTFDGYQGGQARSGKWCRETWGPRSVRALRSEILESSTVSSPPA
jgi:hypothetical protein